MKLLIVSTSQRSNSQSAKVARYITENRFLAPHSEGYEAIHHLELCQFNLPFWDGDEDSKGEHWPEIAQKVAQADALILITPEWGGMASPLLKNFLLMCSRQETAHKPVLLISVCSGISGAYPIVEVKMNALKNNKLVPIPDHLIIRNVENVLNATPQGTRDIDLRERVQYSLFMLHQYAQALAPIRQRHIHQPYPKQQEYCYGM
ncbi:NAD(P)H-dependent oxidoreductase [Shewanella oneidensis MR-1]|uniref:NADPH-dependent azoreductase Azr n=1 Tax=Shewanella oneidensis (strain ATCC 700550 / JCM 31522 / CIP 106686 / LMG 19005 / NCIMB 14063 / MR-1) TaxID=211586 RepID=Q8EBE0_SHEON|nr:NAD(P)H-dependent oxidoreductase [Shewanella oneidensis]AAN56572.1 NADPH-dependent azoreductase Azr [Shewanella oneidensis MR-1]MDX5999028.1 NAD(P)H-dependent oxidoreductase [Shewanella oneidensis]MEE2029311.1 FMN-dependent NADPH-azoreductase [Shewanella oneidensis]QKG97946.1 NAD(P)H-dependent oxidoreductase [Shewanella oneidensis MR-1]